VRTARLISSRLAATSLFANRFGESFLVYQTRISTDTTEIAS